MFLSRKEIPCCTGHASSNKNTSIHDTFKEINLKINLKSKRAIWE